MILRFIFLFGYLNLALLSPKKRQKIIEKTSLIYTEIVKIFEYGKNDNKYWDKVKLY